MSPSPATAAGDDRSQPRQQFQKPENQRWWSRPSPGSGQRRTTASFGVMVESNLVAGRQDQVQGSRGPMAASPSRPSMG